jgi:hypothetical protein
MTLDELRICLSDWETAAVHVSFVVVNIGDWHPAIGQCHSNVDTWIQNNPNHRSIRGWITWHPIIGGMKFTKHSVVRDDLGKLFDITPLGDETIRTTLKFCPYPGDEESFKALPLHIDITE